MSPFIEKANLDEELFSALNPKFVEVGAPIEEMWGLVMPNVLRGFGGSVEKMKWLQELLHRFPKDLKQIDRSWALDALDKAMIFQQVKLFRMEPALPYQRCYGGVPSVGGPSASGMMSGSNASGQLCESLPSPWEVSASPPLLPSAEVHIQPPLISSVAPNLDLAPTTGNEELPLPDRF